MEGKPIKAILIPNTSGIELRAKRLGKLVREDGPPLDGLNGIKLIDPEEPKDEDDSQ